MYEKRITRIFDIGMDDLLAH